MNKLIIILLVVVVTTVSVYVWSNRTVVKASIIDLGIYLDNNVVLEPVILEPGLEYPPTITTDKQKLGAVCRLLDEMRLEYNRIGLIAKTNWEKNKKKWIEYDQLFKKYRHPLAVEKNRLKQAIIDANYTKEQWAKLTEDDIYGENGVIDTIIGDFVSYKETPTLATSDRLQDLKDINFNELAAEFGDPVEDFTSPNWNNGTAQADPSSDLTITTSNVTVNTYNTGDSTYFYRDMGEDGISGDFEFLCEISHDGGDNYGRFMFVGLANHIGDMQDDDYQGILMWKPTPRFVIAACYNNSGGGAPTRDESNAITTDYNYYVTFDRVTSGSTVLTCYLYTDSDRTSLESSTDETVDNTAWRYLYGMIGYGTGGPYTTGGYLSNLDLQMTDYTISKQVTSSGDDGYVNAGSSSFYDSSSSITTGYYSGSGSTYHLWSRFTGITIPQSSNITEAYVEWYVSSITGSPGCDIYAVDEDDPDAPTSYAEFTADPLTTNSEAWSSFSASTWNESPSLVDVIQEIVDSYDLYGDAIMIQFRDNVGTGSNYVSGTSYDGSVSFAMKLHIEYTEPEDQPDVIVSPTSRSMGIVLPNSTYWTNTANSTAPSWPLTDSDAYFTVTNNGSMAIDITIKGTNFTGGSSTNWTLVHTSPSTNEARWSAWQESGNLTDNTTFTTTEQNFITSLASSAEIDIEMRLETGDFDLTEGGGAKTSTITLTAGAS